MKSKLLITLFVGIILVVGIFFGYQYWQKNSWKKAVEYYRKADYTQAATLMKKLPMPKNTEDLRIYAQTMFATANLNESETAYQKIYDEQKDPFSKLMLGNIANQKKNYDKAIAIYNDLIDSNPNYIQAYINLATLYRIRGNRNEAIATCQKGIQNNANATNIYETLLTIVQDDRDSDVFKQTYTKLKDLNPESPVLKNLSNQ